MRAYGEELAGDTYNAKAEFKRAADAYTLAYTKTPSANLAKKLFQSRIKKGETESA